MTRLKKNPVVILDRLTLFALLLVSVVIGLGALTRLLDAGLGCPDWPGCYGFITPPASEAALEIAHSAFPETPVVQHQAWMEMIHRYAASTLGLVILMMTAVSYRLSRRNAPSSTSEYSKSLIKYIQRLSYALLFLVIIQGIFGAWTVTMKLWPPVVTLHLLGGFSTLALLLIFKLRLKFLPKQPSDRKEQLNPHSNRPTSSSKQATIIQTAGALALVILIIQVTLGAWTSSNYAGLACPDFPTCQNQWFNHISVSKALTIPSYEGLSFLHGRADAITRVSIQVIHRVGALITVVALLIFAFMLWRTNEKHRRVQAISLSVLLTIQVILGILAAILQLPLTIALLHNLVAALLISSLIYSITLLYFLPPRSKQSDQSSFVINNRPLQTPQQNDLISTCKESNYGH